MNKHTTNKKLDKSGALVERKPFPPYLKYGIIAFAAVIVIVVALIIYFAIQKSYVATVDSEKIGTGEFKYYLAYQKDSMLKQAQAADPNLKEADFWNTKIDGENAFEVAKKKTLDSLQELKIQLIKAKEGGTKLDATDKSNIDGLVGQIVTQYGSKIKANNELSKEGLSLDDFRKMYENLVMLQKFRDGEYGKLKVTEADIKTYLEKNPDWYKESELRVKGEEAVWARHILISVAADATQDVKDAAKKKAEDLLAKAKAGEDFAKLAKENSEDTGSKDNGGEYLFGTSASFITEFKDTAFKLKPGEISDLVKTDVGYHIIKVEEKYAKDEPVSLKCATEYNEYGVNFIKGKLYKDIVDGWKKDSKFDAKKNLSVYNSITK